MIPGLVALLRVTSAILSVNILDGLVNENYHGCDWRNSFDLYHSMWQIGGKH